VWERLQTAAARAGGRGENLLHLQASTRSSNPRYSLYINADAINIAGTWHQELGSLLTLIRMTKDEKGLAFFKGLLLGREPQKKKAKCGWITPPHPLSWPCCLRFAFLDLKGRKLATRLCNPR